MKKFPAALLTSLVTVPSASVIMIVAPDTAAAPLVALKIVPPKLSLVLVPEPP